MALMRLTSPATLLLVPKAPHQERELRSLPFKEAQRPWSLQFPPLPLTLEAALGAEAELWPPFGNHEADTGLATRQIRSPVTHGA